MLITAKNAEGFHEFCTEVMTMPSLQYLNHGNVISPQFPILLMLDIIYSYYAELDKEKKELLHDDTLRALTDGKSKHHTIL